MGIDKDLLDILACPETKKNLEPADDAQLAKINAAISAGQLINKSGQKVSEPLQSALFRAGDLTAVYPVRENIPILLVDELIVLDQLLTQ